MKLNPSASPHAIVMVGIPGSGKSTFAERFAETFQAPFLNQGKIQKELSISTAQSEKLVTSLLGELLKTKHTLLVEGNSDKRSDRTKLLAQLAKAGYQPLMVWVQTDTMESRRRALKAYPQGSGMTTDEFDAAIRRFEPPTDKEAYAVISGKHTYTTQLKMILKLLTVTTPSQATEPPKPTQPPVAPRGRGIIVR